MGELKGQLLGVLLVVAIFGAIGTVLYAAFKESANTVATKIKEEPKIENDETSNESDENTGVTNNSSANPANQGLLTF